VNQANAEVNSPAFFFCPEHRKEVEAMAVFRIEKTQNYTVMSNHHLRNIVKGVVYQVLQEVKALL